MLSRYVPWFAGVRGLRPLLDAGSLWALGLSNITPALDLKASVIEKEKAIELIFDVPGATADDVSVEVESRILTVRVKRSTTQEGASADRLVYRTERGYSEHERSFALGDRYDLSAISATLTNGVLVVRVGRRAEAAASQIPVHLDINMGAAGRHLVRDSKDPDDDDKSNIS